MTLLVYIFTILTLFGSSLALPNPVPSPLLSNTTFESRQAGKWTTWPDVNYSPSYDNYCQNNHPEKANQCILTNVMPANDPQYTSLYLYDHNVSLLLVTFFPRLLDERNPDHSLIIISAFWSGKIWTFHTVSATFPLSPTSSCFRARTNKAF